MTRERIHKIITHAEDGDRLSSLYDTGMGLFVIASVVPLMFMRSHSWFFGLETVTTIVFIADYLLRWVTADLELKKGKWSYIIHPFTPMAIIDLLSIVPYFNIINQAFKVARLTRLVRIIRVMKIVHHSKRIAAFANAVRNEGHVLIGVMMIALLYIFTTALVMFNVEPHVNPFTGEQTFNSFFDALYWATVTLTTVGYGDLCPVTEVGRLISMLSSLFGVAIIALPSGVITASYLDELRKERGEKEHNRG